MAENVNAYTATTPANQGPIHPKDARETFYLNIERQQHKATMVLANGLASELEYQKEVNKRLVIELAETRSKLASSQARELAHLERIQMLGGVKGNLHNWFFWSNQWQRLMKAAGFTVNWLSIHEQCHADAKTTQAIDRIKLNSEAAAKFDEAADSAGKMRRQARMYECMWRSFVKAIEVNVNQRQEGELLYPVATDEDAVRKETERLIGNLKGKLVGEAIAENFALDPNVSYERAFVSVYEAVVSRGWVSRSNPRMLSDRVAECKRVLASMHAQLKNLNGISDAERSRITAANAIRNAELARERDKWKGFAETVVNWFLATVGIRLENMPKELTAKGLWEHTEGVRANLEAMMQHFRGLSRRVQTENAIVREAA